MIKVVSTRNDGKIHKANPVNPFRAFAPQTLCGLVYINGHFREGREHEEANCKNCLKISA